MITAHFARPLMNSPKRGGIYLNSEKSMKVNYFVVFIENMIKKYKYSHSEEINQKVGQIVLKITRENFIILQAITI